MRKTAVKHSLFLMFLLIATVLFSSCANNTSQEQNNIETHTIYATWPGYYFEEAVNKASRIVYGTVTKKRDTKVHESITNSNNILREYYRDVTIDVIKTFKGEESRTVNYIEMGGTYESVEYIYSGSPIVDIGDKVLIFLNERETFISPYAFFIEDDEGNIRVSKEMLPDYSENEKDRNLYKTVSLTDFCGSILSASANK